MEVKILDVTDNPIDLISVSMGTCYGKTDSKKSRVENAWRMGHDSVFEHAKVTVRIEGISRACSHQLVRHRLASFCQESQRYVKIDVNNDDWYVKPDTIKGSYESEDFDTVMSYSASMYKAALQDGIPAEDARYLLPNACKTNIVMTMNLRELYHFIELRATKQAQWEIRDLANEIRRVLIRHSDDWAWLMALMNDERNA